MKEKFIKRHMVKPVEIPAQAQANSGALFKIVKGLYMNGHDWHSCSPKWCGYDTKMMARVFSAFAPYILVCYDAFFIQDKGGAGIITSISDVGIRVEDIPDRLRWEWVRPNQIKQMEFVPQLEFMSWRGMKRGLRS